MRSERRQARRVAVGCEVECEGPQPDPIRPLMRDLSSTGAFIESATPVAPGTRLALRFVLPAGEVMLAAEVARCVAGGVGVRFVDLSEPEQRLIDDAVSRADVS
jgi:PilZ domain